jgi:hypothetical protein
MTRVQSIHRNPLVIFLEDSFVHQKQSAMPRCTIHVGMPKSGSTSIQDALFYHLRPAGFQYAGFGSPNGSYGTVALFDDPSRQQQLFQQLLSRSARFEDYQRSLLKKFERAVGRASRQNTHLLLSAEAIYSFSSEAMERLRRFLGDRGFEIDVLAYLRPWRSYQQSRMQQHLKSGRSRLSIHAEDQQYFCSYRSPIESLWQVFGRERVSIVKFSPADFPGNCVVQDFCQRLGIPWEGTKLPRTNEGLSLPALRLMVAYNRFSHHDISDQRPRPRRYWLLRDRLQQLTGPPFRVHPSFFAQEHQRLLPELEWVEQQLGFSLDEGIAQDHNQPCVRNDDELLDFENHELEWLARETRQRTIRRTGREQTGMAVAEQMDRLRNRMPAAREVSEWLTTAWQNHYIHWVHGC